MNDDYLSVISELIEVGIHVKILRLTEHHQYILKKILDELTQTFKIFMDQKMRKRP